MKKIQFTKDIEISVSTRRKTFEHEAALEIVIDYDGTGRSDEQNKYNEVEQEAQHFADNIRLYLKPYGSVRVSKKPEMENEIIMVVELAEGQDPARVSRLFQTKVALLAAEADRKKAELREALHQERLDKVRQILEKFRNKSLNDETIGSIAERVLKSLRLPKKSNGLS